MTDTTQSADAFEKARRLIPGGVNSPVRAFGSVGGQTRYIESGSGSRITDVDGNSYVDYMGSWGPLILGHAPGPVVAAVSEALAKGTTFGAPTTLETGLAERVVDMVPSIEKVRFVSSGTEAVMSALRLARGFTGRDGIVKFDGCYHGHSDQMLVKAGSGTMTFGIPGTPGVTEGATKDTILCRYNDADGFSRIMAERGGQIACVIVEPVAGNMGVVPPADGFLELLRSETEKAGALLIFDEVITGFRVGAGGAQELYGIMPDLTTLGKIVGGGLPVGAFGGRAEIMDRLSPDGPVYQAGTLSGNPLAMAAGCAALDALKTEGFYESLEAKTAGLTAGLGNVFEKNGIPVRINRVGSMFTIFFSENPVTDDVTSAATDDERFRRWHAGMLDAGVYLPPSRFEALFVSSAHSDGDVAATIAAADKVAPTLGGV